MNELNNVKVTYSDVYIGDQKLPGVIEKGGVIFKPGAGSDINRLIVTFLVGEFEAVDPTQGD